MRILIIDDDPNMREVLRNSLEAESFSVDCKIDGAQGSFAARTNQYDLILLDLTLPKKKGCDVCKDIRSAGVMTPIILISVISEIQEKIRLLNCGVDDYITKPFSFRELLARIRALLRRPPLMVPEIVEIDGLSLDSSKQKVTRGGQPIYLTRKEFSLLEYLMRNKGEVVSRGMLMEHVWNADSDPFSNTIEAHILNIRKKVDYIKKRRLIHTVPGRGYRIGVD